MLTKIVNHVIGKFADGTPSEAPFFTSLSYCDPENMESDAHASFDCDGNNYKVMCYYLTKEVIIEQQTYSRS
jgi:hypothetical protein